MTNEEMLKLIHNFQQEGLELMKSKNRDYSGRNSAFHNFETSSQLSGVSVERGILVRICDKLSRLGVLIDNESSASVTEEKLNDTIQDAINYLGILYAFRMGRLAKE